MTAAIVAWICAVAALPALALTGYLAAVAVAALRRQESPSSPDAALRLAVIVPAHNEAALLGRCLASLEAQTYPASLRSVVVIADNCTDATARVAAESGARVIARTDPDHSGKGHALRWAFDRVLAADRKLDALVVVDADSIADPRLLEHLAAVAARGAEVVQADYSVLSDAGARSSLRSLAFLVFHRARFLGRAALGMGCALVGNGMLFQRSVLERVPWDATSAVEDLEYTVTLRLKRIVPRFAPLAHIAGPAPTSGKSAQVQRLRWEGGRFFVMRTRLPLLVREIVLRRRLDVVDMALDLAVPPLGLLTLLAVTGAAATTVAAVLGAIPAWSAAPWLASVAAIAIYVLVGLRAAGAPARSYVTLLAAPWFLLLKLGTYARLSRGLRADRWERTPRASAAVPDARVAAQDAAAGGRVDVGNVPIDVVGRAEAVSRVMRAVDAGAFLQVCTVNLQYLVSARRNHEVRDALCAGGLNVADGAPVVWLARRFGAPIPERVTGADLVPDVLSAAAERGLRVFLLGGQGGVAAEAAEVVRTRWPGADVVGICEPPPALIDGGDGETLLETVRRADPDVLLVALGHPKQELWIHRHRSQLPPCVAIGVGCTLDLLAGRRRRAPRWMQRHGLEWLFRLLREPRRLLWRYMVCAMQLLVVLVPMVALHRIHGQPTRLAPSPSEPGPV